MKRTPSLKNAGAWVHRNISQARLRAAMAVLVPIGYEDETGFHFGIQMLLPPLLGFLSSDAFC